MEQPTVFTVDVADRIVKISGEIDVLTASAMIDAVLKSSSAELDLSEVTFMGSTGLHALLLLLQERATLRVVAVSPAVQHLLDITNMADQVLQPALDC